MKKSIAVLLIIVTLISCSACGLFNGGGSSGGFSPFLDVDFSTGTYDDQAGKIARSKSNEGTIEFENDSDIGRKVGVFKEAACVAYLADYSKMSNAFTMECYVKVKKQGGFGHIMGTYWFNSKRGVGIGAGKFELDGDGMGQSKGLSMYEAYGSSTTTVAGGEFDEWNHLVYVHNGSEGKDYYYVNGVDVTEGGIEAASSNMTHDDVTGAGFRIGCYNMVGQFGVNEMRIAYARVYDSAASAEQVAKLYENR